MIGETAEQFMERTRRAWSGRSFRTKDVGRRGWHYWITESVTLLPQSNLPQKVLLLERIRLERFDGVRAYSGGASRKPGVPHWLLHEGTAWQSQGPVDLGTVLAADPS